MPPPLEDPLRSAVYFLNLGTLQLARQGFTLERDGKIPEAISEFEKALKRHPLNVSERITLISLYGKVWKSDKAAQQFQAATALDLNQAQA